MYSPSVHVFTGSAARKRAVAACACDMPSTNPLECELCLLGLDASERVTFATCRLDGPALGALLANASNAAVGKDPKGGAPPVVLWGRPGQAGGAAELRGGAVEPAAARAAAACSMQGSTAAKGGDAASRARRQGGRDGVAGAGVKAHAQASDLLGSLEPLAPASDLLGSRFPPRGAGHTGSPDDVGVSPGLAQGHGAKGDRKGLNGASGPIDDLHLSTPPAAPLSVADASVITKLSETPGWGAYAGTDKKKVVERRKAVVEKHSGMFSSLGDLFFGAGRRARNGRGGESDSGSEEEVERVTRKPERLVPPSPSSSAHLRQLLVDKELSPGHSVMGSGESEVGGVGGGPGAGPLTLMGSWMPSITTWEWSTPAATDAEYEKDESTPASPGSPSAASESTSSSSPVAALPAQQRDSSSGFAMHGLCAKMWKVRRRTIPIKPMTSDERELYEQGRLGVEHFVIEEEEEEEAQSQPVPAPPSLDKIHQAFASTLEELESPADQSSAAPPLSHAHRLSPSKVSAVFDELGAGEEAAPMPSQTLPGSAMPGSRTAPPSAAEKLDMMRIFAEAEGGGGARDQDGGEAGGLSLNGEVDVTKLSDEELFRQLQAAQQKLVGGALDSSRGLVAGNGSTKLEAISSNPPSSTPPGAPSRQVAGGVMPGSRPGQEWRADPELQAELHDAEEKLREQQRELEEARARALQEEELMRREQMRLQGR